MEMRRNHLALLSREELAAGLALWGTPDTAPIIAAQVYAIPPEEQIHFEWIDSTLMFTSCVSPALAERIAAFFGRTPEMRAELERQQREFQEWVNGPHFKPGRTPLTMEDVIFDTRTEQVYEQLPTNGG
jgi:hypothetical protein